MKLKNKDVTTLTRAEIHEKTMRNIYKGTFWGAMVGVVLYTLSQFFAIGLNMSPSLPGKVYIIKKHDSDYLRPGETIGFNYYGEFYPHGTLLTKHVVGLPGDVVTEKDRIFYINGQPVGRAKEVSLNGEPLEMNPFRGVIPAGKFWFATDHVDSFDSRYKLSGLGDMQDIVGRAYKIW